MQTGALGATASVVIAALAAGCATAPRPPPTGRAIYFRSPPLDYRQPGPTSSDGEVMGAHQRSVDDLMLAGPSGHRFAPGWQARHGQLYFEGERARTGYGVLVGSPSCYPPPGAAPLMGGLPVAADPDPVQGAALAAAWQDDESPEAYTVSMASMAAELRREQSSWLRCDTIPAP